MLIVTLKENERVLIGENVIVMVMGIRGHQIRLGFQAPEDVLILREKLTTKKNDEKGEVVLPPAIGRLIDGA
jgi:carbon storage regulator